MMTIQDVERVIKDRAIWGRAYRDEGLESKRRSAILWLRHRSSAGWVCDKILTKQDRRKLPGWYKVELTAADTDTPGELSFPLSSILPE